MANPPNSKTEIKKSIIHPIVLVTGAARFLGVSVVKALARAKLRVVAIDNLSVGNYRAIREISSLDNVTFLNCDIAEPLPSLLESVNFVIHLAATRVNYADYPDTTIYDLQMNGQGTLNLLEFARASNARFVYASSTLLYRNLLDDISPAQGASHREVKSYGEAYVGHYTTQYGMSTICIRLPKVYGPGMNYSEDAPLGKLVANWINNETLLIEGSEVVPYHYLYIDDAAQGIVDITLEDRFKGVIPLLPEKPTTGLEIAEALKDLSSSPLAIEVAEGRDLPQVPQLIDRSMLDKTKFRQKIFIQDGLRLTVEKYCTTTIGDEYIEPEAESPKSDIHKKISGGLFRLASNLPKREESSLGYKMKSVRMKNKNVHTHRLKKAITTLSIFALLSFALFPVFSLGYNFYSGQKSLKQSQGYLLSLDDKGALGKAEAAKQYFAKARTNLDLISTLLDRIGLSRYTSSIKRLADSGGQAAEAEANLAVTIGPLVAGVNKLTANFLTLQADLPLISETDLAQMRTNTQQALIGLGTAQANLNAVEPGIFPGVIRDKIDEAKSEISTAALEVENLNQTLAGLPEVLGFSSPTRYLILFQNSNELRPTGGFIGSYAELEFSKGALKSLIIDDIYNPDGQLIVKKIEIPPPEPIKKILGQPNWFLRDANWDVSFPEAYQDIKQMYALETGRPINGAITMDLKVIEDLLEVTGTVTVPVFNEDVTSDNFYEKTQYHAEAGFTPGSNLKKTFLTALMQELLNKLGGQGLSQTKVFSNNLLKSLQGKHMLMVFDNSQLMAVVGLKNWDGAVVDKKDADYLYVVDANLGANKANYFINRTIAYETQAVDRDGKMLSTATVGWTHTGTSDAWPGGVYNNYVRVLVPKDATITKALLVSKEAPEGKDVTGSIVVATEAGKTAYGYHVRLLPRQSATLSISYHLPKELWQIKDKKGYSLIVQKQPGTDQDPLNITFHTPFGREVVVPFGVEQIGERIRFTGDLSEDREFNYVYK